MAIYIVRKNLNTVIHMLKIQNGEGNFHFNFWCQTDTNCGQTQNVSSRKCQDV